MNNEKEIKSITESIDRLYEKIKKERAILDGLIAKSPDFIDSTDTVNKESWQEKVKVSEKNIRMLRSDVKMLQSEVTLMLFRNVFIEIDNASVKYVVLESKINSAISGVENIDEYRNLVDEYIFEKQIKFSNEITLTEMSNIFHRHSVSLIDEESIEDTDFIYLLRTYKISTEKGAVFITVKSTTDMKSGSTVTGSKLAECFIAQGY